MSFLISHPKGYSYISPADVPEDFVVKCYAITKFIDSSLPIEQLEEMLDHWEITYDLPNKTVIGLYRYEHFNSFEEASVKCNLLGLRCIACEWLCLPPHKGKDGTWVRHFCSIPYYDSVLLPIDTYDQDKVKIYKKDLAKTMMNTSLSLTQIF